jgi:hypothetical protein
LTVFSEQGVIREQDQHRLSGPSVSILLGHTNLEQGLRLCPNDDGVTEPTEVGDRECVCAIQQPEKGNYVYFALNPSSQVDQPRDVILQVEFFDAGQGWFRVQYDTSTSSGQLQDLYTISPRTERLTNTRQWKTTWFLLPGARFRHAQNAGADFRLDTDKSELFIRRLALSGLASDPTTETPPGGVKNE